MLDPIGPVFEVGYVVGKKGEVEGDAYSAILKGKQNPSLCDRHGTQSGHTVFSLPLKKTMGITFYNFALTSSLSFAVASSFTMILSAPVTLCSPAAPPSPKNMTSTVKSSLRRVSFIESLK